MKRLVCILGGYFPYFSPSAKMADNILNELKNEYEIIVIAQKNHFGLKKTEEINGLKVYRINDYNRLYHHFLTEKIKASKNGFKKRFFEMLLKIKQTSYYLYRLCRKQSVSRSYINSVKRLLKKLDNEKKIDILFPVSTPHEAVVAATEFKENHRHIALYPYKMDRFANGNSLYETEFIRKIRYPRHILTEKKTLALCNKLFALPPIKDYYEKSGFLNRDKVIKTEHPLLVDLSSNEKSENGKINITYAGSFDKTLRNPQYVLNLFSKIDSFDKDYQLNLYTFGNCQSIIDEYKPLLREGLIDYGKISSDLIEEKLRKADILLVIGNNSDEEVPSKLFEYLSYCKPILHFYYNDKDAYIAYLNNHPCAISLKMDEAITEENAKAFDEFCKKAKNASISFEDIYNLYCDCTPKFVANTINQEFQKDIDKKNSVIVAHPMQQHSMRLAKALKDAGFLHSYITTEFYKDNSKEYRLLCKLFGNKIKKKMDKKKCDDISYDAITFCKIPGYFYYYLSVKNYRLSCLFYPHIIKRFGIKVAKYAIKNNVKAVVMYDFTAIDCFRYLEKKAPNIKRILDVSSLPVQNIDDILDAEEKKGNYKYFIPKRQRYSKKIVEYFRDELKLSNCFLSPGTFIDKNLISDGVLKDQIYRAEYGVDLEMFKFNQKSVATGEKINFVFAGRIEGAKGIHYLLNAFDEIIKTHSDVTLTMIGALSIDKEELDSRGYITYYPYMEKTKLIELYKNMHIFIQPTLWESLPLSLLEALSCGLCILCSDHSSMEEMLEKGIGKSFKAGDEKSLTAAIEWFFEHKSDISVMSENTKHCISDYSWNKYYEKAQGAISKILDL